MKKTFIITILLSSLVLAGCGKESAPETEKSNELPTPTSSVKEVETYKEDYAKKSELQDCLKGCDVFQEGGEGLLSREMCVDTCWADEAVVQKDITICDEKVSPGNALIQSGCRMNVAEETMDEKYCGTIEDGLMRMGCYSELAKLKKEPAICENVEAGMMREICLDGLNDDEEIMEDDY